MEWGTLSGLSVRNDHNRDVEDLKYFQQLNQQKQAMLEAKNKMFMDDIEFQNATNDFDAQGIKQEGDAAIQQLSNLRKAHPSDWTYNPDVQLQMKQIKQGMKSSPSVLRSIAYKDAVGKYNDIFQDYLKNPSKYNDDEINGIRTQLANYNKFGHADGQEGVQRDGGPKPITFNPPTVLKSLDDLFSVAKDINPDEVITVHNGRDGAFHKKVSDKSLIDLATTMYNSEPSQYKRFAQAGKDPIQEIANGLKLRARTEDFGGYEKDNFYAHAAYEAKLKQALQTAPQESVYKKVIVDSDNIPIDAEDFSATFGSTPKVQFKGPDGKPATADGNIFYATNLRDENYNSKNVNGKIVPIPYQKNGIKVADGFFLASIDDPKYADVLYDDKLWGKDMKVKDDYKDTYEIFTNPKGEKMLKIRASTKVNANSPDHARKFESKIKSTNDQRNEVGSGGMLDQQVFTDEQGTHWVIGDNGKYVKVQ